MFFIPDITDALISSLDICDIRIDEKTKNKFKKKVKNVNDKIVEVGHFDEQGYHSTATEGNSTPIKYTQLAAILNDGNEKIEPFYQLEATRKEFLKNGDLKDITIEFNRFFSLDNNKSSISAYDKIGVAVSKSMKDVYGSRTKLRELRPFTIESKGHDRPLDDSGELESMIAYKTKGGKIKY